MIKLLDAKKKRERHLREEQNKKRLNEGKHQRESSKEKMQNSIGFGKKRWNIKKSKKYVRRD